MNVEQGSEALNLQQILGIIRRRVPLIVLCVAVVAGAAWGFSKQQPKKYTATASLAFSSNQLSQQVAGLPPTSSSNLLAQQASNLELVKLGDMAAKTASKLGHGLTEEKVAQSLSIAGQGESSIVTVTATATSPTLAAEIANTYVHLFVTEQQATNRQYFKSALALVNRQLAKLSTKQRLGPDGLALQDRAQSLGLLAELQYGNVHIAQEALPPTASSSPKTPRNTFLGALIGLLAGLGLAILLERSDRRIRRPDDLEAIYRLPVLGAVPKSGALRPSTKSSAHALATLPPAEAEAFNLIRARLRFLNRTRDLRAVLLTSAAPGEGKSTIACYLAEAATRGGSRVLLLELDLRHPTLAKRLALHSGPGSADVLSGAIPMDEATHSIGLQSPSGERGKELTLDVLAAGGVLPRNPGDLIGSHAMTEVLQQAKTAYDLVVIDAPPLTVVADAFPLLSEVDGVIVVSWVGHSRRDQAEELHQILDSSGAPLLGVIANYSKPRGVGSFAHTPNDGAPPPIASTNGASAPKELIPTARA